MRNRLSQVTALLQQARGRRRLLQEDVAALAVGLQSLRSQVAELGREMDRARASGYTPTAAALVNRDRYTATLAQRRERTLERAAETEASLLEQRDKLYAVRREVRAWEQLLERLELAQLRRVRRGEQELVDQFGQRASGAAKS